MSLNPGPIIELSTAYWSSMVLLTANRLGVFSLLSQQALSAESVAQQSDCQSESMTLLLNACVALGFLAKEEGLYSNSDVAEAFLVEGKPSYLGEGLRYLDDLYEVWGKLDESVRSNRPALPPDAILGSDSEKTRHFVLGMHNRAQATAGALAFALDLSGRRKLFDVGGGPGTYSRLLVKKTPGLSSTILDLPGVVEVGRELISDSGYADRIDFIPGDYTETSFPSDSDVVLMSGMLHREKPDSCRALLAKAYSSLLPGGLMVVSDIFFDDSTKVTPPFATLFALTMFLTSEHGAAHARTEMKEWLSEAGFVEISDQLLSPALPHRILTASKTS